MAKWCVGLRDVNYGEAECGDEGVIVTAPNAKAALLVAWGDIEDGRYAVHRLADKPTLLDVTFERVVREVK